MLGPFDWVRLSRTGAELLATLRWLAGDPKLPSSGELGPPYSALRGPCQRCWVYPLPAGKLNARYCPACQDILARAGELGNLSRKAIILWGFVNQLPRQRQLTQQGRSVAGAQDHRVLGAYVHDESHFLVMLYQRELKPWLQELVLYHGLDLKGFIQIFHTTGIRHPTMGEFITRIVHNEARFPMDRLRVRFFADIQQIFNPVPYEREGVLTFDIADFLSTLEMAAVFRTVLRPEEQKLLRKLLRMEKGGVGNVGFYWGRVLGRLSQEAKDMLNAWKMRQWSEAQINLFYELVEYVTFYQSG